MKKALALSIDRQNSATLSFELETFACHGRAYADYIVNQDYELFIHNPYKAKYKGRKITYVDSDHIVDNAWIAANGLNGFDRIFTVVDTTLIKNITGDMNWGISDATKVVCQALKNYTGEPIRSLSTDYRPRASSPQPGSSVWNIRKQERCSYPEYTILKDAFDTGKIVVCLTEDLAPCVEDLFKPSERVVDRGWYDLVRYHLRPGIVVEEYNPDIKEYDFVYVGSFKPDSYRQESLDRLVAGLNCATFGKVKIKGWPTLTNYKNVMDSVKIAETMAKSRISLVVCNEWHNFVTLRFYEAMVSGSIMVVDSKYKEAAKLATDLGLKNRVVDTQEDILNLLNNNDPVELYQEQFNIYKDMVTS